MTYAFGFIAGTLSILSPCVLPMVPIVLAGAAQKHRLAPLALIFGVVSSFLTSSVVIAALGLSANIEKSTLRNMAAVLMACAGVFLIFPFLYDRLLRYIEPALAGLHRYTEKIRNIENGGLFGQFALGLLLGIIWSPCAGPTLGAASGLLLERENMGQAAIVMMAFSIGAISPLILISYAGKFFIGKKRYIPKIGLVTKPVFGISLLLVSILIISGWEKNLEIFLTEAMPEWLVDLTTKY